MIIDTLKQHVRYHAVHPLFQTAFHFLENFNPSLEPQVIEIQGKEIFAIIEEKIGKERQDSFLEIHRNYIDIHYTISGADEIGWRSSCDCLQTMKVYDPEKDIAFFHDPVLFWTIVPAGFFAIFYPDDAHAPTAGKGLIRKVVIKIAV